MASEQARHRAAQAWGTPMTSNIPMDGRLAEAFADILDEERRRTLSSVNMAELLAELGSRIESLDIDP